MPSKRVHKGGYFRSGKWIAFSESHRANISDGLAKREKVEIVCCRCGGTKLVAPNAAKTAKYCSRACLYAANYTEVSDPVLKKAIVLGANLVMGGKKRETIIDMLRSALGGPCPYCAKELTLENVTVDHKEAYGSTEARRSKAANRETRQRLDRIENLHCTCTDCNLLKGELNHDEFVSLLGFLDAAPNIKKFVFTRFRRSRAPFKRRRAA